MASDVAAFIYARLDEDEAAAKANIGDSGVGDTEEFGPSWPDYQTYSDSSIEVAQAYLDRFRPLRRLREVAAGRAIMEHHGPVRPTQWPDPAVLALAAVYSDHPDYNQRWKP